MLRKFIRYVSLITLGLTAISCYILADTFFVSKGMGVGGLTALNLAIPVSQLSTGIVMIVFNFYNQNCRQRRRRRVSIFCCVDFVFYTENTTSERKITD